MIGENERDALREEIAKLLDEYDYEYNDSALNKIVNEWAEQKGWLLDAFKKHPNYVDGKYLIAFDMEYERTIDKEGIKNFSNWLTNRVMRTIEYMEKLPEECKREGHYARRDVYNLIERIYLFKQRELDADLARYINNTLPNIKTRAGAKTSRVINKICTYLHYNEHPDYNKEFAKYADALSPMKIKRHTILSLNPLDYLTMSFGNSWTSCHTIDKQNKRGIGDSFGGCYSSGTVSYMLDNCSMVLYTVDEKYEGTDYYSQPKINRQMFHYGEDKLIQSRLYPQHMDSDKKAYIPYRTTVQEIISNIFDFPNTWEVIPKITQVESEGTHYRDYIHFSTCTLSRPTGTRNNTHITIGAEPICVECGTRHDFKENINCCSDAFFCADCGRRIRDDDAHYIDGEYYCDECCHWCNFCDEYVRDEVHYVNGYGDVCEHCLDEYFAECDRCGNYHRNRSLRYCDEDDASYCELCYEERMEELEEERREAEKAEHEDAPEVPADGWRVVDREARIDDYIRLNKEMFSFNRIGDILRVDAIGHTSGRIYARVYGRNHPRATGEDEYLWNYHFKNAYEVIEKLED